MSLRYAAEVALGLCVLPAIQSYKLVQSTVRFGLRSLHAVSPLIAFTLIALFGVDDDPENANETVEMGSVVDLTSLPSVPSSENSFGSLHTPSSNGSFVTWSHVDWTSPPGLVSDHSTPSSHSDGRAGGSAAGSILRYRSVPLSSTPMPWRRPAPGTYRDAMDSPVMTSSSPSTTASSQVQSSEDSIYISFGSSPARRLFHPASSPSSWFSDYSDGAIGSPQYVSGSQQISSIPRPWKRYQVASLYRVHAGAVEVDRIGGSSAVSPVVMSPPQQLVPAGSRRPALIASVPHPSAIPAARILTDTSAHNTATSKPHFVSDASLNPRTKPYLPIANMRHRPHEALGSDASTRVTLLIPFRPQVGAKDVGAVILQGNEAIDPTIPTRQSLSATDKSTKFVITRRSADSTSPLPKTWAQIAAKLPPKPNSDVIATAVALSGRPSRSGSLVTPGSVTALASDRQEPPPDARWDEEVSMITSEKESWQRVPVSIPHLEFYEQPKVVKTSKQPPHTRRNKRVQAPIRN